jgi:hypothetical protein
MLYTIEELSGGWKVVHEDVCAGTDFDAVSSACVHPGMYRTAAPVEPQRHYFWLSPRGDLEDMDEPCPVPSDS